MRKGSFSTTVIIGLFMLLTMGVAAEAAEVKVISANAMRSVINELGPQFERATGHKLVIQYEVVGVLKRQIDAGEGFDVAILTAPMIGDLVKAGKIGAATGADIARSGIGVIVRAGAPKPDISSADAFKRALLNAKSIAYNPEGASGAHLTKVLARLGIAEQMKPKTKHLKVVGTASKVVADGEAELGFVVISAIQPVPGAELLGPLPSELQSYIVYTGGVGAAAKQPDAARALIKHLTAPAAVPVLKAKGMEPVAR